MGLPRSAEPNCCCKLAILQNLCLVKLLMYTGWETFSQIPTHGLVSMSYKCAPEDRNFKAGNFGSVFRCSGMCSDLYSIDGSLLAAAHPGPSPSVLKVRRAFLETYTNWHCDVSVDQASMNASDVQ